MKWTVEHKWPSQAIIQCGIHVLVAPEVRRRGLVAAPTVCSDNWFAPRKIFTAPTVRRLSKSSIESLNCTPTYTKGDNRGPPPTSLMAIYRPLASLIKILPPFILKKTKWHGASLETQWNNCNSTLRKAPNWFNSAISESHFFSPWLKKILKFDSLKCTRLA